MKNRIQLIKQINNFKIQKTIMELMIVEFFYFIVNIRLKLDLIGNEVIGIDGTFIQANSGINNRASRKELDLFEKKH